MLVLTFDYEFSLYTGADGKWIMHQFSRVPREGGESYLDTFNDVSNNNPFAEPKSVVIYDAWR